LTTGVWAVGQIRYTSGHPRSLRRSPGDVEAVGRVACLRPRRGPSGRCEHLQSEALQRGIHMAPSVIENWNSANGIIAYGKSGEIATSRLDEQVVSILCLHLLQICLVYVNTFMLQHVLADRAWRGRMTLSDLRVLTPLISQHVNPDGRFSLDLRKRLPGLPVHAAR